MLRPLTIGSWQKARGRGCNANEVCARRLFFFRLHLEKHRGHATLCVCEMTIERYLAFKKLGFLEQQTTVSSFSSSALADERCSNLSFESPNQNPKNRTLNSHRDTGGTRRVLWEVTMYGHLPLKKLGFLAVQLWPIFLLKYSRRRAMLQLEFRWSKPDKKQPKQSRTETRKQRFARRKHWNHDAGDGPAAAGCPVSNPDNNCANGLFKITVLPVVTGFLYRLRTQTIIRQKVHWEA